MLVTMHISDLFCVWVINQPAQSITSYSESISDQIFYVDIYPVKIVTISIKIGVI